MSELTLPVQSTNVRFRAPAAATSLFRAVQAIGIDPAAALLERFYLTPARAQLSRDEVAFLASGRGEAIEVANRAVATWSWGEGRTVLLAHGWGSSAGRFRTIAPALVEAGYRVVAFDAPGHGASSGKRSSLPEYANAVLAIGAREHERRGAWPHGLIAHSFGAAASILAQHHGLNAARSVFLAPSTDFDAYNERMRATLGLDDRVTGRLIERLEKRLGFCWDALRTTQTAATRTTPALIVHDPADPEVPFSDAQLLQRSWRGSRLIPVHGAGHRRILHDSNVVREVVSFIGPD